MSEDEPDLRSISLGAGVQSTTLYLMACAGEIGPRPDVAIFADTGAEPPEVYAHLWRLAENFGHIIPIRIVSDGDIEADIMGARDGRTSFVSIPLRVMGADGRPGALMLRQCTREYKITPINRELRRMLGLARRQRAAGVVRVEQWIGISLDEVQRMKPSHEKWVTNRWPLIEQRMTRRDCMTWLERHEQPVPPKSACYFCPFHDNATWRRMRDTQPELWARAVSFDREIRQGKLNGVAEDAYLHGSLLPLDEAPIDGDTRQADLFGNECEGMCGV
jgi:hypothetical protein